MTSSKLETFKICKVGLMVVISAQCTVEGEHDDGEASGQPMSQHDVGQVPHVPYIHHSACGMWGTQ